MNLGFGVGIGTVFIIFLEPICTWHNKKKLNEGKNKSDWSMIDGQDGQDGRVKKV